MGNGAPAGAGAAAVPAPQRADPQDKGLARVSRQAAGDLKLDQATTARTSQYLGLGKYAVVVGINHYDHNAQGISDLRYAASDAQAVYNTLVDPKRGGFPPGNVKLLTDTSEERATDEAIGRALGWLSASADSAALVVIYFSGHGYEDRFDQSDARGRSYLLPVNADLRALDNTALERDAFVRQLDRIRARKVVVILDACHSGGVSRGAKGVGDDLSLGDAYYRRFMSSQGRVTIASSSAREFSYEDPEAKQGVFTTALLNGLSGAADQQPSDGIVTLHELQGYVGREVEAWAKKKGVAQRPQVEMEAAHGEIPLAINYEYLRQNAQVVQERGAEAGLLRSRIGAIEGMTAHEMAAAIDLVNRHGLGEAVSSNDAQNLAFLTKLVEGAIDLGMYRAGVRTDEPPPRQQAIPPDERPLTRPPNLGTDPEPKAETGTPPDVDAFVGTFRDALGLEVTLVLKGAEYTGTVNIDNILFCNVVARRSGDRLVGEAIDPTGVDPSVPIEFRLTGAGLRMFSAGEPASEDLRRSGP